MAPAAGVGQLSQGQSGQREYYGEQREESAQLGIGKGELVAQRFEDRGQRLAIVEVEDVDQKQNGQCRSKVWISLAAYTNTSHLDFASFNDAEGLTQ